MAGTTLAGLIFAGLILADIILAGAMQAAYAQPPRRSTRKSQPVPIARTAPDTTATIPVGKPLGSLPAAASPAPAKPAPVATRNYGEELPKPFDLPVAPRTQMRSCGQKWQAIKMKGEARSDTWREFATKCLAERAGTPTSP